ncbi:hypothetical protein CLOM_g10007 [Closterium sp. NIES-68]|nr:hypothetical protein CLOM_g10007 [Closterium sp. NIES-68]GJP68384.1 hypothetical protein CLOP_g25104 [Closterium sp. NIES-67]
MDGAVVRLMRQKVPRIVAFPVAFLLGVALLLVTRQPAEIARVEDLFEASPPTALSTFPPPSDASSARLSPSDIPFRENQERTNISEDDTREAGDEVHERRIEAGMSARDISENSLADRSTDDDNDPDDEQCWDGRVRVYVYDLPRRMNLGLLEPKWKTRQRERTNQSIDDAPIRAWAWPAQGDVHPTAWQHSLEYYLVADLLHAPSERDPGVAAVRVRDPAQADVFLVPFFASTMVNLLRRKDFPTYKALAMELAELMNASPWWHRRGGRDHVLCVTHPNALESVRHYMAAAAFIAVDLARYAPGEADLHKDIIAPYGHLVETYTAEEERRDALRQQRSHAGTGTEGGKKRDEEEAGRRGGHGRGGEAAVAEAKAEAGSRKMVEREGGGDGGEEEEEDELDGGRDGVRQGRVGKREEGIADGDEETDAGTGDRAVDKGSRKEEREEGEEEEEEEEEDKGEKDADGEGERRRLVGQRRQLGGEEESEEGEEESGGEKEGSSEGEEEEGDDGKEEKQGDDASDGDGSDRLHGQGSRVEAGAAGAAEEAGGAADTGEADAGVFARRKTLLYFQGTLHRKDRRKALFEELQGEADVHVREAAGSSQSIRDSQQGMRQSRFCLHVEGDTPSSSRFFNALMSGCVPVVVSDYVELPFESTLDYSHLALFFSQEDALVKGRLVSALRQLSEQDWLAMWHRLHQVQRHFEFQHPAKAGDAVDMVWQEVRNRLPSMRLLAHRDTRLTIPDWSA